MELKRLAELPTAGRDDSAEDVRRLGGRSALKHNGRMRLAVARSILDMYPPCCYPVVADPYAGIGTTLVAAVLADADYVYGTEIDADWCALAGVAADGAVDEVLSLRGEGSTRPKPRVSLLCRDAAMGPSDGPPINLLLTSPPWPNAHTPGKGAKQLQIMDRVGSSAGTDYANGADWGCGSTPNMAKWGSMLTRTLKLWTQACRGKAMVLVHVGNYVRRGKEVRVDVAVADVLLSFADPKVEVLGYHPIPLGYTSAWREWAKYPLRRVRALWADTDGGIVQELACGHKKRVALRDATATLLSDVRAGRLGTAHCTLCPARGAPDIVEHRLVVGRVVRSE